MGACPRPSSRPARGGGRRAADLELAAGPPERGRGVDLGAVPDLNVRDPHDPDADRQGPLLGLPAGRPGPAEHRTAGILDPSAGEIPSDGAISTPPIDIDNDGDLEPAPLYCSGQSLLPNGEVLITGGNWPIREQGYTTFAGMKEAWTFNPFNETITQQPSCATAAGTRPRPSSPTAAPRSSAGWTRQPREPRSTTSWRSSLRPKQRGGIGR